MQNGKKWNLVSTKIFLRNIFVEEMSFFASISLVLSFAFTTISRRGSANGVLLRQGNLASRSNFGTSPSIA